MEEPAWLVFQDAQHIRSDSDWGREGMHSLQDGDHLTIYASDGAVAWTGVMKTRRLGWFSKLYAGSRDWYPEDVEAAQWLSWFEASPSLDAELRRG